MKNMAIAKKNNYFKKKPQNKAYSLLTPAQNKE